MIWAKSNSTQVGNWKDNFMHGEGYLHLPNNGMKQKGEFKYNKMVGKGEIEYKAYTYIGEFVDGKPEGNGKITYANGEVFEGFIQDNKKIHGSIT